MAAHDPADNDIITSRWPLPTAGVRFLVPQFLQTLLREHTLSRDLYPLALGYYPGARGHHMRRRSHTTQLLIYCSAGAGQLQIEGQRWPVRPGDLILLPAGTAHTYAADAGEPWSIHWIHFEGERSRDYMAYLQTGQPVVPVGLHPRLIAEFDALFDLRHAGFTLAPFIHGSSRLRMLLTELAGLAAGDQRSGGKRLDLDHLLELMHRRMDQALDLEALAAASNLSKYHFIRRFKALTGHSPIQHFIHLKMQYACQLLDRSDEPLKRVAARVGYDDPYYFSRLFKRVIGISPQQYREQHTT
jgi:AraC-like DNA-binding protein